MDKLTLLIKSEIKRQYKSLRNFSEISSIPYSTLTNALQKGIGTSSFETVVKICSMLNLRQIYENELYVFNENFSDIIAMLTKLDERGVHTIQTILKVEYDRCMAKESQGEVKSYSGISFVSHDVFDSDIQRKLKTSIKNIKKGSNG